MIIEKLPISVIIPNYNSGRYLLESINSIFSPSFAIPSEILIVDDGSTDESLELAKNLQKQYPDVIKVIELGKNSGAALARLRAAEEAKNDLLCCPDADDILSPGALEKAYASLNHHDMVIFDFFRIDENNIVSKGMELDDADFPLSGREACKRTFSKWRIHERGIFKKKLFMTAYANVKSLDFYHADEMITRNVIYEARSIVFCSDARYYYRSHADQTTRKQINNTVDHLKSEMVLYSFLNERGYLEEDILLRLRLQNQMTGKAYYLMKKGALTSEEKEKAKKYLLEFNHWLIFRYSPFKFGKMYCVMLQSTIKQVLYFVMLHSSKRN